MSIREQQRAAARVTAGSVTGAPLNDTYRDVLDFALRYKVRCARRDGRNAVLPATITDALLRLVSAGQAGKMPPDRLKRMIVRSSSPRMSHRDWRPEPGAEQRAGLLAGASRRVRIG